MKIKARVGKNIIKMVVKLVHATVNSHLREVKKESSSESWSRVLTKQNGDKNLTVTKLLWRKSNCYQKQNCW